MTALDYIQAHPKFALIIGAVHLLVAESLHEIQVPIIVMQFFQMGAWTITGVVGLITIFGWIKKTFFKTNENEKN